jgi:hypothetical protein
MEDFITSHKPYRTGNEPEATIILFKHGRDYKMTVYENEIDYYLRKYKDFDAKVYDKKD